MKAPQRKKRCTFRAETSISAKQSDHSLDGLLVRASASTWDPAQDLDWQNLDCGQRFPFTRQANLFCGFAPYESASRDQQITVAWQQHTADISDILYGEWAALTLSTQLRSLLKCKRQRGFLETQIQDEARHVEFFNAYLARIAPGQFSPSTNLVHTIAQAIRTPDPLTKLLVCQLIIESLAMAWFKTIRMDSRVALLKQAIALIARDEARHVSFGIAVLTASIAKMHPQQRRSRELFVTQTTRLLLNRTGVYCAIGLQHGWCQQALMRHLQKRQIKQNQQRRHVQRLLWLNMTRIGLGRQDSLPGGTGQENRHGQ